MVHEIGGGYCEQREWCGKSHLTVLAEWRWEPVLHTHGRAQPTFVYET